MEISIDVRGTALQRVGPEVGIVRGAVTADGPQPGPVRDAVAATAARVRDACPGRITVDQVRVTQHRPWNEQGEQLPLVHTATVSMAAEFSDFEALGAWVLSEGLIVHGVEWRLSDETRAGVERQTRQSALRDAVTRAQDYADTLALGAVEVRSVRDPGVAPAPAHVMAMRSEATPQMEMTPEPIEIFAEVHATFVAGSVVAPD